MAYFPVCLSHVSVRPLTCLIPPFALILLTPRDEVLILDMHTTHSIMPNDTKVNDFAILLTTTFVLDISFSWILGLRDLTGTLS